jgi:muramoyltetrapeptide carboxypeptidase
MASTTDSLDISFLRPRALRRGSRVALISPAGPSTTDRVERALRNCERLGLEPVMGASARTRSGYLAGPDSSRLTDIEAALHDPAIDAIWAIRGGYGTMRLLDRLDLAPLLARPRPFIGFSDNTAVHAAIARAGIASFHGPHAGGVMPPFTETCFRNALFDTAPLGTLPLPGGALPVTLCGGAAEGVLAGGNLALLASMCGTPFALTARGRILVIEDVNEPAYRIDRALTQLRLAGCLDGLAGIAFGQFSWTERGPEEDPPVFDLLRDITSPLGVPVVAGLPFGHVDAQWCLPLGTRARLDADRCTLDVLEAGVS